MRNLFVFRTGLNSGGEQYNRKLSDILFVQQDISSKVSEQLRLKLTGEEKKEDPEQLH